MMSEMSLSDVVLRGTQEPPERSGRSAQRKREKRQQAPPAPDAPRRRALHRRSSAARSASPGSGIAPIIDRLTEPDDYTGAGSGEVAGQDRARLQRLGHRPGAREAGRREDREGVRRRGPQRRQARRRRSSRARTSCGCRCPRAAPLGGAARPERPAQAHGDDPRGHAGRRDPRHPQQAARTAAGGLRGRAQGPGVARHPGGPGGVKGSRGGLPVPRRPTTSSPTSTADRASCTRMVAQAREGAGRRRGAAGRSAARSLVKASHRARPRPGGRRTWPRSPASSRTGWPAGSSCRWTRR